jgi:hypothetical protein
MVDVAIFTTFTGALIGIQTLWINRSLTRLESGVDDFRSELHRDLTTHTEAIADLRERVARLET